MTFFAPAPGPRVFALPPGADFLGALVAGIEARLPAGDLFGPDPLALAEVEIWVNTRRAARALEERMAMGGPRLLPRIRVVTELADAALAPVDLPVPVPPLRRKLELARLVRGLVSAAPELAPGNAVFDLADSLAELLDELQDEGLSPSALARVDAAEHAAHWQKSLAFLQLISGYLEAAGPGGGPGRLRAAATALAARWAVAPPTHPVIVAGSTGSRGAMRVFMTAVASLPQGALVLPGLDPSLPPAVWSRLGRDDAGASDHPQHGFRRLADAIGFDPATVPLWRPAPPPAPERNALVSLALRPAPVTDQWREEGAALLGALGAASERLSWIEAPDPRREALAIALALREAAETGQRAALITPDRTLARRVAAELDRWGVIPDDSAGRPLGLTPPGTLLRRLAVLIGRALTPADLLSILKHPLVASGSGARAPHLRLTARLERAKLRGGAPWIDWPDLGLWADAEGGEAPGWIVWLHEALAPLAAGGAMPLAHHLALHRSTAEALAAGPAGDPAHGLWEEAPGVEAAALFTLAEAEAEAGGELSPADYRGLFQSLLVGRDVPEAAAVTHPGLAIWGTLEARIQSADLVVLGGLNEGIWPRLPGADPWLGRGLRRTIGLPSPEDRIGLSAHDFQQAMGAPSVIVSRAIRDVEAPTVASRWLLRLENLLLGLGTEGAEALKAARARGQRLVAIAQRLDEPTERVSPARRPAPRPPSAARPRELSVTQVETLIRDPYAIYARKVLRLRPLDRPGREPDAISRGIVIHAALDDFVTATLDALPEDAEAIYRETIERALVRNAPWPAVRAIWTARLARASRWFLGGEAARRRRALPEHREVSGRREVPGLEHPFAVTARADRLDVTPDGRVAIYDYKSGNAKSDAEIAAFHLQLPLEAAIAAAGGFEGLAPAEVVHLELLYFGNRESRAIDPETLARTWERFAALAAHYQSAETPFIARLRPQKISWAGDYDHLSRKGEWTDGDEP
ncbi:double-strand break repair protein AddB [Amaricoccus macauensis]|uniref:Double-strand break repair protein AddB n=1 Tax=Amaricoccus macauensis TaxID=57001 RepID=A0A840SXD2_9RHOB|nr:double-strand break repair protein AddB [Amaricoccus macauensis]